MVAVTVVAMAELDRLPAAEDDGVISAETMVHASHRGRRGPQAQALCGFRYPVIS